MHESPNFFNPAPITRNAGTAYDAKLADQVITRSPADIAK
jgi:hypothetical protein